MFGFQYWWLIGLRLTGHGNLPSTIGLCRPRNVVCGAMGRPTALRAADIRLAAYIQYLLVASRLEANWTQGSAIGTYTKGAALVTDIQCNIDSGDAKRQIHVIHSAEIGRIEIFTRRNLPSLVQKQGHKQLRRSLGHSRVLAIAYKRLP